MGRIPPKPQAVPPYEVKFFNLPLLKFIADQLMLILYFRLAVMTPASGTLAAATATPLPPDVLATQTTLLVAQVFLLYIIWDALQHERRTRFTAGERDNAARREVAPDRVIGWAAGRHTGRLSR